MAIDPQIKKILESAYASGLPPIYDIPVAQSRKRMRDLYIVPSDGRVPDIQASEYKIPVEGGQICCRAYTPDGEGPFPVFVYCHGGGWVLNDLDTHDDFCRMLTAHSACVVVSAGYRRPPEHRYPTPLRDAFAATLWAYENAAALNGDSRRFAIGGDSSGGNLAAAVCLMARASGKPNIRYQVLLYPVTDYYEPGSASYEENGSGYLLDRAMMVWFWDQYLSADANPDDPFVSPLRAPDLSGLPSALILTAEYDPLRDEGEAYAEKLKHFGNEVTLKRHDGMIHGFLMQWRVSDKALEALAEIGEALKTKLYSLDSLDLPRKEQ